MLTRYDLDPDTRDVLFLAGVIAWEKWCGTEVPIGGIDEAEVLEIIDEMVVRYQQWAAAGEQWETFENHHRRIARRLSELAPAL